MTTVNASVKDSSRIPIQGYINIQLLNPVVENGVLYTTLPNKVELVNGLASFVLEPTEDDKVLYEFSVYQVVPNEEDTLAIPSFRAAIPDSNTPINLSDLALNSGLSRDRQDSSLVTLVRRLYNDSSFWDRLEANIFSLKGEYSSTSWYSRGDIVFWNGGSYIFRGLSNTQGVVPSVQAIWQQLTSRGANGTGTAGNDSPYNTNSWLGATDAPTRNTLRNIIELLALKSDLPNYLTEANLTNYSFNSPTVTTPPLADNSTRIVNSLWAKSLFATSNNAVLTGNPVATSATASDNSNRIATTKHVKDNFTTSTGTGGQKILTNPNSTIVSGSTVVVLNSSGYATINIGITIPGGYVLTVCNGDVSAGDKPVHVNTMLDSSFTIKVTDIVNTNYRVNWVLVK